jgi:rod shape-determining protein MreB
MFDKFFNMFSHDLGIDLGTANTLVHVQGKGIAIREPSIVARQVKSKQVIAIGTEAKKMLGKTPSSIEAIKPLEHGVISDFDAAAALLTHFIKQVHQFKSPLGMLARPRVVVGIPSGVTEVERRAVWEAALQAGARECYLIEEPMAAAIGAGISVFQPTGVMTIDIGGGTTEIAVISLGGIVVNRSLKVAGRDMDQAIVHYIRLRHGLIIGEPTAEDVKIKIGSAYQEKLKGKNWNDGKKDSKENDEDKDIKKKNIKEETKSQNEKVAIIRGRDLESGMPRSVRIGEQEIREAIGPVIAQIVESVMEVVEETPPELTSDILEHGILLTGGGSMLPGIDEIIMDRTKISVTHIHDPLTTVVRGTAKLLEDDSMLARVKVTGGLR